MTPAYIETRKIMTMGSKVAIAAIAGPGHKPTSPQPTPKRADPITNFLSRSCFLGNSTFVPSADTSLFFKRKKNGANTNIAPPITNISEASQL